MIPFIKVDSKESGSRGKEFIRPVLISLMAISTVRDLKSGGSRITMTNGETFDVTAPVTLIEGELKVVSLGSDFGEARVETEEAPHIEASEEDDEVSQVLTAEDIRSLASENALALAEELGVDITEVEPNAGGKIGKPEVQKHFDSLNK